MLRAKTNHKTNSNVCGFTLKSGYGSHVTRLLGYLDWSILTLAMFDLFHYFDKRPNFSKQKTAAFSTFRQSAHQLPVGIRVCTTTNIKHYYNTTHNSKATEEPSESDKPN